MTAAESVERLSVERGEAFEHRTLYALTLQRSYVRLMTVGN